MPALSTKTKHYYRERIRSVLVQTLQAQVSNEGIRQRLRRDGLTLDRHYIGRLVNKIHVERTKRADTWTLNIALASFQDAMSEIVRVGWEMANDRMAEGRTVRRSSVRSASAYNAVFEKLFDAGVFEHKLGTLEAAIRNTPLPEEKKQHGCAYPLPVSSEQQEAKAAPSPGWRLFGTAQLQRKTDSPRRGRPV